MHWPQKKQTGEGSSVIVSRPTWNLQSLKTSAAVHILLFQAVCYLLLTVPLFPNRLLFEKTACIHLYIAEGEWWRLLTSLWIHTDFSHLFANSMTFLLFGLLLEAERSRSELLLVYLSSGIIANLFCFFITPLTYIHVGSSGAVFGTAGAVFAGRWRKERFHRLSLPALLVIFSFIITAFQENENVYTHIFGFLWGMVCGWAANRVGGGG
jgi:membrane associated rhomboid family serine protease